MELNIPLMANNIERTDLDVLIEFLKTDSILTQSKNVVAFEEEWSRWLGMKRSVFVNSGSSANLLSLSALKYLAGDGEVLVPTLTWVSDIASVIQCGFKPVFVDLDPRTMGMAEAEIRKKVTKKTKAVFLTHILGLNALSDSLLGFLKERKIPLIEDVCESHGATHNGKKLGSFGLMSNFSFYYAHHMTTIEGGMISTDDEDYYQVLRMFRSHGMVREATSDQWKKKFVAEHPDLNPQFIFAFPAYNVRSTELNAVLGRSQLKRLDANNEARRRNFKIFLDNLDPEKYRTDFEAEGSCNYAFLLILKKPDDKLRDRVTQALDRAKVEYRRGTSGGGNQLRQPYLKGVVKEDPRKYPQTDHVHFYGYYIGNYPGLEERKIRALCDLLNSIPA
ncbi:MAG: DegT/DnrJ/EryC1/StrS aminotransferase family protein [Elusimicrobia bacterium]|nr:DegT/DnrJ/EryC1/StrS aminotransferase family protein [Elusimicrobiota bacterium]